MKQVCEIQRPPQLLSLIQRPLKVNKWPFMMSKQILKRAYQSIWGCCVITPVLEAATRFWWFFCLALGVWGLVLFWFVLFWFLLVLWGGFLCMWYVTCYITLMMWFIHDWGHNKSCLMVRTMWAFSKEIIL